MSRSKKTGLLLLPVLFLLVCLSLIAGSACAKNRDPQTQTPPAELVTLASPKNLDLSVNEILTWDAVAGAEGYSVKITSPDYDGYEYDYQTEQTELDIFPRVYFAGAYDITVKALGDGERTRDSEQSEAVKYEIPLAPIQGGKYSDGRGWVITGAGKPEHGGRLFLPSEAEGLPVVKIADFAFKNCEWITSVIIPDSVETIGSEAFRGCSNLKRFNFPQSIKSVGGNQFQGTAIERVEIPNRLQECPNGCFADCAQLKEVTIREGVTRIYGADFKSSAIESISIPASVERIYGSAFKNCESLKEIKVAEGNEYFRMEGKALIQTKSNPVYYGKKNTLICAALCGGDIPEGVENIGTGAFSRNIGALHIPASLTAEDLTDIVSMDRSIAASIESITVAEGNPYYRSEGNCVIRKSDGVLVFGCKNSVIPQYVTEIGTHAFAYMPITGIELPEGLKTIGPGAFYYTDLERISLPAGLETIKTGAFRYCRNLKRVVLPAGITSVEGSAFDSCQNLKEVVIPSGVREIKAEAFRDCFDISVTLASGVKVGDFNFGWKKKVFGGYALIRSGTVYDDSFCELGYDGTAPYVTAIDVSKIDFTKDYIVPYRDGYTFKGWSSQEGGETVEFGVTVKTRTIDLRGQSKQIFDGEGNCRVADERTSEIAVSLTESEKEEILKYTTLYAVWEKNA